MPYRVDKQFSFDMHQTWNSNIEWVLVTRPMVLFPNNSTSERSLTSTWIMLWSFKSSCTKSRMKDYLNWIKHKLLYFVSQLKTGRISILLTAKIINDAQSHSGKKLARIAYSYLISPQNHISEIFLLNTDSRMVLTNTWKLE